MKVKKLLSLPTNVKNVDPNQLGEFLREITFVGEGYGCYEIFDVRKDAREWSEKERLAFIKEICPEDEWVFPQSRGYTYEEGEIFFIDVFWYWEGDGDLTFRIRNKDNKIIRIINNPDCKKDYGWIVIKRS